MIVAASAAVAALAFVVLVIYLLGLLRAARDSLHQANETLEAIRSRLDDTAEEALRLLGSAEQLVRETGRQLQKVKPLSDSLQQAGEASRAVAAALQKVSGSVSRSAVAIETRLHRHQEKIADVSEWAALSMQMLQQWSTYRSEKKREYHEGG